MHVNWPCILGFAWRLIYVGTCTRLRRTGVSDHLLRMHYAFRVLTLGGYASCNCMLSGVLDELLTMVVMVIDWLFTAFFLSVLPLCWADWQTTPVLSVCVSHTSALLQGVALCAAGNVKRHKLLESPSAARGFYLTHTHITHTSIQLLEQIGQESMRQHWGGVTNLANTIPEVSEF